MTQKAGRKIEMREGWRDNVQPFISAKLGASKNPGFVTIAGAIGAYGFSPTQEEEIFIYFHINHDYEEGTTLYPHIHWAPSTTNTGVVRWGVEWIAARGHDQEVFSAPEIFYIEQEAPGIINQHMVAEIADPGIYPAKCEADSVLLCRIFRDATHANDTYPDDALGFMADLHYYADKYTTIGKAPNFHKSK